MLDKRDLLALIVRVAEHTGTLVADDHVFVLVYDVYVGRQRKERIGRVFFLEKFRRQKAENGVAFAQHGPGLGAASVDFYLFSADRLV